MKLLVFSDSHGNTSNMRAAVALEQPDRILHLGDVVRDAMSLAESCPGVPLELVPGNCDHCSGVPLQKIVEEEGKRILMTHGHVYHVKVGMGAAVEAALKAKVDILLFGHTHDAVCLEREGLWVMNPGSIRGNFTPTYGVIELADGRIDCHTAELYLEKE